MSSTNPKRSSPETILARDAETELTFDRWIESDLIRLETEFPEFITAQSARRAAQATMAHIIKLR